MVGVVDNARAKGVHGGRSEKWPDHESSECNAVAPGFITTDMTDVLNDKIKDGAKMFIPLKRFGEPKEIAAAVRVMPFSHTGKPYLSCNSSGR